MYNRSDRNQIKPILNQNVSIYLRRKYFLGAKKCDLKANGPAGTGSRYIGSICWTSVFRYSTILFFSYTFLTYSSTLSL